MTALTGTYTLPHAYLTEAIDQLARERIKSVLGGFPRVKIVMFERSVRVEFADKDDCLFAFQRHPTIDIVPGEIEWRFKMS